jgi:predicted NAD-dependent protein-ADP-ribosyltransferase YbiA (DUF1768 family)
MDVGSKQGYPASALSNFTPHPFVLEGVSISSMEGFLQSLKFSNPEMQKHVCTLIGFKAKCAGREKKWFRTQTLHWQGKEYKRDSVEYQDLLDRAYEAMFRQNEGFRKALAASGEATLTHSIGKTSERVTVLTVREFCGRLTRLRAALQK